MGQASVVQKSIGETTLEVEGLGHNTILEKTCSVCLQKKARRDATPSPVSLVPLCFFRQTEWSSQTGRDGKANNVSSEL